MSGAIERMKSRRQYLDGLSVMGDDVLGDVSAGDFVPWLNMVGKVAGGMSGGNKGKDDEALKRALAEEKARQEAQRTRNLLYVTLGIVGSLAAGTVGYLVLKK